MKYPKVDGFVEIFCDGALDKRWRHRCQCCGRTINRPTDRLWANIGRPKGYFWMCEDCFAKVAAEYSLGVLAQ